MNSDLESLVRSLFREVFEKKSGFSLGETEKMIDRMSLWIGDIACDLQYSNSTKSYCDDVVKQLTSIIVPGSTPQTRARYDQMMFNSNPK